MWYNIDSSLYIGSNLKLSSLILSLKKFSHKKIYNSYIRARFSTYKLVLEKPIYI